MLLTDFSSHKLLFLMSLTKLYKRDNLFDNCPNIVTFLLAKMDKRQLAEQTVKKYGVITTHPTEY